MDCPRCKLVNPPTAKRCDCGYDFETQKVEVSYSHQGLQKEIKTALVAIIALNVILMLVALSTGEVSRILGVVAWSLLVWVLYARLVRGSNGARIALAVLTFPIGTAFFLSAGTKLYCLQTVNIR